MDADNHHASTLTCFSRRLHISMVIDRGERMDERVALPVYAFELIWIAYPLEALSTARWVGAGKEGS